MDGYFTILSKDMLNNRSSGSRLLNGKLAYTRQRAPTSLRIFIISAHSSVALNLIESLILIYYLQPNSILPTVGTIYRMFVCYDSALPHLPEWCCSVAKMPSRPAQLSATQCLPDARKWLGGGSDHRPPETRNDGFAGKGSASSASAVPDWVWLMYKAESLSPCAAAEGVSIFLCRDRGSEIFRRRKQKNCTESSKRLLGLCAAHDCFNHLLSSEYRIFLSFFLCSEEAGPECYFLLVVANSASPQASQLNCAKDFLRQELLYRV